MSEHPMFVAASAQTQIDADDHFHKLLTELVNDNPFTDMDALKERLTADILYVAGYVNNTERAGQLYAHKSPYRR